MFEWILSHPAVVSLGVSFTISISCWIVAKAKIRSKELKDIGRLEAMRIEVPTIIDTAFLTGKFDEAGYCHVTGAEARIAPSPAPEFNFDDGHYIPDIASVLDRESKVPIRIDASHKHCCYICGEFHDCKVTTMQGHRVVCTQCTRLTQEMYINTDLNYMEAMHKIYELAVSSGAPESAYDLARREELVEKYLEAQKEELPVCARCHETANFVCKHPARPETYLICTNCHYDIDHGSPEREKRYSITGQAATLRRSPSPRNPNKKPASDGYKI